MSRQLPIYHSIYLLIYDVVCDQEQALETSRLYQNLYN